MKIDSSNYTLSVLSSSLQQDDSRRKPLGIIRNSGQLSPQSGYWQLSSTVVSAVVNLKKGEMLPYYQGSPVKWTLIEYDLGKEIEI
ncbi:MULTISPECIES: hypothetical protein [Citrobacter]|uniref:Uncharacterized protein n=1 Tax=Citrobacter sedlakii TaxID=67826 RepID=A0ABS0ZRV9_9ENTR|nr:MULTISPECIES: hypothetical protein [Citrobacter]EHG7580682.1 hypothetical protein [Citrobacter sedlakii]EIQ7158326.1 hypothetical protein [Citrobacter sedlakii]MBJ8381550.1 hypothetical protein [Citrobacter sedlakii]MBM9568430.1 hypothetical protein [Citrobacter sedlakii]MBN6597331.1 hypothetical protein [Citrobacter sedlakii]